jgi:hypothetical protein
MNRPTGFARIPRLPARPFDWQMLRSMSPRTAAAIALGGLSLLLGAMAVALTLHGRHGMQTLARQTDHIPSPATSMPDQGKQPTQPTWPGRETLRASLRQPPFYPDRKLPVDETPAAGGDERYRLAGTVVSGQRRFAIIENRATKETKRLGMGETLDGLPIIEVLPDRVILGQGMQRREIRLTWAPSPKSPPRRTAIAEPEKRARQPKPAEQPNNTAAQRPSPGRGVRR